MTRWLIEVYLAKPRQLIADVLAEQQPCCLRIIFECYLGAGA